LLVWYTLRKKDNTEFGRQIREFNKKVRNFSIFVLFYINLIWFLIIFHKSEYYLGAYNGKKMTRLEIVLFIYFSFPNYETCSCHCLFCFVFKDFILLIHNLIRSHLGVFKKLLRLKSKAYQSRGFVWKFAIMKITAVVLMLVVSLAMMGLPKTAVEANPNPKVSSILVLTIILSS
jgi:hypothetical protein